MKKSATSLTKQLFLLSSVKTSGRFFQIFVTFSEKLNFIGKGCIYIAAKIRIAPCTPDSDGPAVGGIDLRQCHLSLGRNFGVR